MPGSAKSSDLPQLQFGDPCWIIVNSVNSPTGTWKGVVESSQDHGNYAKVVAVLTEGTDISGATTAGYQGREPSREYRVIPCTETITSLLKQIAALERVRREEARVANIKIETLRGVILDATKGKMSKDVRAL